MKWILLGQLAANLLTGLTYFLLGGFSGAGICLLTILQSIVMFIFSQKKLSPPIWVIIIFVTLYLACSILYYQSIIDIFSALAAVLFCLSIVQTDAKKSRLWYGVLKLHYLFHHSHFDACRNGTCRRYVSLEERKIIIKSDKKITDQVCDFFVHLIHAYPILPVFTHNLSEVKQRICDVYTLF